ncbi:MAG: hypothetical protein R8G66_20890 [Cytophagales bacterium]|nr:hypothetical protein [Cytophagales bacterium]
MKQRKPARPHSNKNNPDSHKATMGIKPLHASEGELRPLLNEAENEVVEDLNWDIQKQPYKR